MREYQFSMSTLESSFSFFPIRRVLYKRIFDVLFSLATLILGSPVFFLISFLIWISSPGPIFYLHSRIGRAGKIVHCIKFRTMYKDSEKVLQELLEKNADYSKEWHKYYKLKNDPRITPIGRFLRRTSLDELPQFFNVLRGDLSVVGPRPVIADEVQKYYGKKAWKILSMRPGLTGIWQTSGRNEVSMTERVKMEESYIDTYSFFKDLFLICKTIPVMLFSKGAY